MNNHHEQAGGVTVQYDARKPHASENDRPLRFKADDLVIYTSPAGIEFPLYITNFCQCPASLCGQCMNGARYLLDWNCPWLPAPESRLRPDKSRAVFELEAAA